MPKLPVTLSDRRFGGRQVRLCVTKTRHQHDSGFELSCPGGVIGLHPAVVIFRAHSLLWKSFDSRYTADVQTSHVERHRCPRVVQVSRISWPQLLRPCRSIIASVVVHASGRRMCAIQNLRMALCKDCAASSGAGLHWRLRRELSSTLSEAGAPGTLWCLPSCLTQCQLLRRSSW